MRTYDFFGFFITLIRLTPDAPLAHTYDVHELNDECRTSVAVFIRLWPSCIAIGFGRWRKSGLTEKEMFEKIFSSRNITMYGEDGEPLAEEVVAQVRAAVAHHATDPDDEWTLLQMLDLDQ